MISRVRMLVLTALVAGVGARMSAQNASAPPEQLVHVHCGKLIDGVSDRIYSNVTVIVKNDRISELQPGASPVHAIPTGTIDLSRETCLPGLIDTHTTCCCRGISRPLITTSSC